MKLFGLMLLGIFVIGFLTYRLQQHAHNNERGTLDVLLC